MRTKGQLLDAGIALFSEAGYAGVAVDEIVGRAGCNKRMLYHYFGSKDGLYVAVLREVFGRLEATELEVIETCDSRAAVRDLLARYFDFLQANPEFVNLLMWENLNSGKFLDAHPNLLTKNPVLERLDVILREAAGRGELVETPDHRQLLVLLIGVCFIYFSNRHTLRHTLGLDMGLAAVRDEGLKLTQDVIVRGLFGK